MNDKLNWLYYNIKYLEVQGQKDFIQKTYARTFDTGSRLTVTESMAIEQLYKRYKAKELTILPPVTTFNTTAGQPLGVKIGLDYVLSVDEAIAFIGEIHKAIEVITEAKGE